MKNVLCYFCFLVFVFFATSFRNSGSPQTQITADSLFKSGEKYIETNKTKAAISDFNKALDIYRIIDFKQGVQKSLYQLGLVYASYLGDWKKAEINWTEALKVAQSTNDSIKTAQIEGNLGIVYDHLGQYEKAEAFHLRSLAYFRQTNNSKKVTRTLRNLGLLKLNQSDFYQAANYFDEAMKLAKEIADNSEIGELTANVGYLLYLKGDYPKAKTNYLAALQILGDSISIKAKSEILNNLGTINYIYDDTATARQLYTEALRLSDRWGDKDLKARVYNNLGNLYLLYDNYDMALDYHKQSLNIKEEIGSKLGIAISLNNIGLVYQSKKDFQKAKRYFKQSLREKKDLGYLWGEAFQYLCFADLFLETGDLSNAQKNITNGLQLAEKIDIAELKYKLYTSQAELFLMAADTMQAMDCYNKSIAIIESIGNGILLEDSRKAFLKSVMPIYKSMIDVQQKQGNTAQAFAFYERMKMRNYRDVIEMASNQFEDYLSETDKAKQSELKSADIKITSQIEQYCSEVDQSVDINELVEQKRVVRGNIANYQKTILASYPALADKVAIGTPVDLNQAANILKNNNEAFLVYVVQNDYISCFILRSSLTTGFTVLDLKLELSKDKLIKLIDNILEDWEVNFTEEFYTYLIKPVESYLTGVTQLCIIPDSYLYSVPFQALRNPVTSRYLIEDYAVYYDYSLTSLQELIAIGERTSDGVLAFGNPNYAKLGTLGNQSKFESLPKSEEEVITISEIYGGKSRIFLKDEASETNFKMNAEKYGIVHIASHGIFDEVNPLASCLLLTADDKEDGVLSASEVMNMNMNSNLVVLSACETARGRLNENEKMMGLGWAFFGAKVPTILASLWQVDDKSTRMLMEEFHRISSSTNNYAVALQTAQIKMLRNTPFKDPFFWAPFVLIGDFE